MGIERITSTVKLEPENAFFLEELRRGLYPYEISRSSLVNLCVSIVRQLYKRGDIGLEPKQLQSVLALGHDEITTDLANRRPAPGRQDVLVASRKPQNRKGN